MSLTEQESKLVAYILFFGSAMLFITMDIYVPSLPDMQKFFNTSEDVMQWTLTVNFVGSAISGLFLGPLGDRFGRKKIIQVGLVFYLIGTLMCLSSQEISVFMVGRIFQSFGSSAQAVVTLSIITDLFHGVERAKILAITGLIYPISFAMAPILGAKLSAWYGWKASFVFVLFGAIVYFFLFTKYVPETMRSTKKYAFSLSDVFQSYSVFLKSKLFIAYNCVQSLTIAIFMLYLANSSFIYKARMGLSSDFYMYFQAVPCLCQIVGTIATRHILREYGMRVSFIVGAVGYVLSFCAMGMVVLFFEDNPYLVCAAVALPYTASSFVFAVCVTKAMELFPHMAGTAAAIFSFFRTIIGSVLLGTGTIMLETTVRDVYGFMMLIVAIIVFVCIYLLRVNLYKEEKVPL